MDNLKRLIFKAKADSLEYYTFTLITVGLPLVALSYFDWRAMLLTFIVVQSIIGVLALAKARK